MGPDGALYILSINSNWVLKRQGCATCPPDILPSTTQFSINENSNGTFAVGLSSPPSGPTVVNVARTSGDTSVSVSPASLTFSTLNWATPQFFTLTAAATGSSTNNVSARFTCSATGLVAKNVQVFVIDSTTGTGPSAQISSPKQGAVVFGAGKDFFGQNNGVAVSSKAEFYIDGVLSYTDTAVAPPGHYHLNGGHGAWDTTPLSIGTHTLAMKVTEQGGALRTSTHQITVTVANLLLSDPFNDGILINTGSTDPQDTSWAPLVNASLGIAPPATSGLTGNALAYTGTAAYGTAKGGAFTSQALNVGDSVVLSHGFRLTSGGSSNKAIRFGLGSGVNSYVFILGYGTAGSLLWQLPVDTTSSGSGTLLPTTPTTGIAITDTLAHTFDLSMTRMSANTLSLGVSIDGIRSFSATTGVISNFLFDRVLLGNGDFTIGYNVDNVTVAVDTTPRPDVIVTSVSYNSATGLFTCVVKNQGTAATPAGVPVGVGYSSDGVYRTYGFLQGTLAAGASVTIGTTGAAYTITPAGPHTITAFVDDVDRFPESNEDNNTLTQPITVP